MNILNEENKKVLTKLDQIDQSTKYITKISKLCKHIDNTDKYNYCLKVNIEGLKYLITDLSKKAD